MKQKNTIVHLVILVATVTMTLINPRHTAAGNSNNPVHTGKMKNETSCITPITYEQRVVCRAIEAQILAVTVRIEMEGWSLVGGQQLPLTKGGKSHGTIVAGRYLVTHNHFKYDLTQTAPAGGQGYTGISIRSSDGRLLLDNAPLSVFTIAREDDQTLVLEFADPAGRGLFDKLGLPSAPVLAWHSLDWQAGMELAHIDWNGERAHVDWVVVEEVITVGTTPHVQVSNFAMKGASGGGAFWNGQHVGNVWGRNLENNPATGEVSRLYTLIALNSAQISDLDR